jgi:hypothetical protein
MAMIDLDRIYLPRSLDRKIEEELRRLSYNPNIEVLFLLYGGALEETERVIVKVNEWLYLGYKKLENDSFVYKSSVTKDIEKLVGNLHSHPKRLCEFRGKYSGKCNPTEEDCFSNMDLWGSALLYNILSSSKNNEKNILISIVYCVPEKRYVGVSYPGRKLAPVELYRD